MKHYLPLVIFAVFAAQSAAAYYGHYYDGRYTVMQQYVQRTTSQGYGPPVPVLVKIDRQTGRTWVLQPSNYPGEQVWREVHERY